MPDSSRRQKQAVAAPTENLKLNVNMKLNGNYSEVLFISEDLGSVGSHLYANKGVRWMVFKVGAWKW